MPRQKLWLYSVLNLILLTLFASWLWFQNQPVDIVVPQLKENGKMECASYAPYYEEGMTPFILTTHIPKEQIDRDLKLLAERFDCVRTYSVTQGLDYVPEAASKIGLEVLLGVWIGWTDPENNLELNTGIKLANQYPDVIRGLIIGNEVMLRQEQPREKLLSYIKRANDATDVPVTYADVWEFWLKNKSLEEAVDYVTVHILPYWEDEPQSIDDAIPHTVEVMAELSATFTKPLFIGETGWPSVGRHRNAAVPGNINQARYIREFVKVAHENHWNYNLIEAIDQPWKRILEGTVGGHWGLYDSNLNPKFSFTDPLAERDDGWKPLIWSLGAVLLMVLIMQFYKNRKTVSGYIAILPVAALSGLVAYIQWAYLVDASRNLFEWVALGGVAIVGWISILAIPGLLAGSSSAKRAIEMTLWALVFTALLCGVLIVFDGRYRDFPLSLYSLPALQFGLVLILSGITTGRMPRRYLHIALLAVAYALLVLWQEPLNQLAQLWLGLTLLLCLAGLHKNPNPDPLISTL